MIGFGKFKLVEPVRCNLSYGLPFPTVSFSTQTFRRNKLIKKSVYYLSTEVGDGFADIIGSQQTITLGVDHLALVFSHSLRLISVLCFDRFVTGYQKLNHHQESQYRSS